MIQDVNDLPMNPFTKVYSRVNLFAEALNNESKSFKRNFADSIALNGEYPFKKFKY